MPRPISITDQMAICRGLRPIYKGNYHRHRIGELKITITLVLFIVSNGFISKVTPVDQDITYTAPNLNIPPTPNSIRPFICSFQTRKLGNGPSAASQYSHRAVKIQAISKVVDMGRQVPVLVPSTCHQKCDSGLQTKSSTSQGIILTAITL